MQRFVTYNILKVKSVLQYCDKYGENVGFPKTEEWRKELCISAGMNAFANLETYRDSWNDDIDEKLQEALRSPYFTQLEQLSL